MDGSIQPVDTTSCSNLNCIYITDWKSPYTIHRLELDGKKTRWPVKDIPHGISVTASDRNVLVSCFDKCKLKLFTTHGELILEIILQDDMIHPTHAIQIGCQSVVSHVCDSDPLNRVCVVDANGNLTRSYGGSPGSADGQLCNQIRLYLVDKGIVLVADYSSNRVLLLSSTLRCFGEVVSKPARNKRFDPTRMCLHEKTGRLYITDDGNKNVLVYQLRKV